ncbi:MAG: MBL fold metallo-hydrolase [Acidimicrobiia bacterium]|nr:MBL fold metallo-hydrolase [Acidimicrobiia bacterium]
MFFRQYYLGCLSHASYLIGDEVSGRAVVVDPQRDVSQYLADATARGLRIERVIETHFHADFLSGHLELAAVTGAVISYGEAAAGKAAYAIETLADGQRLSLGEVTIEVLATPGHTPESICLVVRESADAEPYGVLTGDTLFIGDVGRPDLLTSVGVTQDGLARQLHRSLRDKLLALPDATQVFPAHGAGSACGKQLSTETVSTIGEQRSSNYALAPMSEDEFVAVVTEGQSAAPLYFAFAASRNKEAHELLAEAGSPPWLPLDEVLARQAAGAVVLDTRAPADFARGHLRGSLNVGLEGRFAEYAGDIIRADQDIVLVGEPGHEREARLRLGRIGFDRVVGALEEPVAAFLARPDLVEASSRLTAAELAQRLDSGADVQVLDVRAPGETRLGSVAGSVNVPLPQLLDRLGELGPGRPTVVVCAGGYRSSIGASVLAAASFADVSDLLGGYAAWAAAAEPAG